METLSVGEFKAGFSEVLKRVLAGEEIQISFGKRKQVVARLVPNKIKKEKRKIGILEGVAKIRFEKNYKITEEEFLGL